MAKCRCPLDPEDTGTFPSESGASSLYPQPRGTGSGTPTLWEPVSRARVSASGQKPPGLPRLQGEAARTGSGPRLKWLLPMSSQVISPVFRDSAAHFRGLLKREIWEMGGPRGRKEGEREGKTGGRFATHPSSIWHVLPTFKIQSSLSSCC